MSKQVVFPVLPSGRNVVAGALAVALMMPNAAAFAGQDASEGFAVANDANLSATEDVQNQIDALEETANQAKSESDAAAAANQEAQEDLAAAQRNRDEAAAALTSAQASAEAAQSSLGAAQRSLAQAGSDKDAADADIATATAALSAAERDTKTKASTLTAAQTAQAQVDSANAAAQSKVSTSEQAVKDAQAAYDAAKADEGTVYDFFESIGDGSASKINDNFAYRDETNLGQEGDASYLDNFARTFQYMKECNAIRVSLGLSELKVTSGEMAIALANCNWSDTHRAHAGDFDRGYNGENLAWGYPGTAYTVNGSNNGGSPFNGWYDKEKQLFDAAVATGNYPGIESMTAYEIYTKYPALYSSTGHYLNIIDPDSTTTGFAYNTVNNTYDQTFGVSAYGYKTYSVDEYEKLFTTWREEQTASEKAALELAKTNLASAQKAASSAQSAADAAAATTQAAKTSYDEAVAAQAKAEDQLKAAQTASAKAQADMLEAQSAVTKAQAGKEKADADVVAAQASADAANAAYDEAKENADAAAKKAQTAEAAYNEAYADFVAACIQESSQFSDVDTSGWYAMGVGYCAGKGLFSGYAETTKFGVGDSMTRAQLAVVLWRHFDAEDAAAYDEAEAIGTDAVQGVESHRFYTGAANWAVAKGVINGVARDGGVRDFAPDEEVTFEQLIAIIANASGEDFESTDTASLDRFTDAAAVSDWAASAMAWAVDRGLVNGSENGDGSRSILPDAKAARERTATVLMNAFQAGVLK